MERIKMNQLGIDIRGPWPLKIETKEYGTFIRVYPNSDESWTCSYQRIQDGKYYSFDARNGGHEFVPNDLLSNVKEVSK